MLNSMDASFREGSRPRYAFLGPSGSGRAYCASIEGMALEGPCCRPARRPGAALLGVRMPKPKSVSKIRVDYAKLAGRSDAVLKAKTGCTWERWVKALDHAQAYTWSHREIAKYVEE